MAKPVINIKFLADMAQFSTGMQNASRTMDKLGKKMQTVGAGLTVGLTLPILAFGAKSAAAFDVQAKALAQVEAGIKSTGGAAQLSSVELQKMASALQASTLFGDEEILQGVTAQLLSFTNIAGEQFERTQLAALNLATRLDGDLQSSAIQLGKALNDPVLGLSALAESGIQFTNEQKTLIAAMVETGRIAEAQTLILDELEKQYGGSAEAAAKAGTGPFKQLANILGDISEEFGAIIVEAILPFVQNIKELAMRFSELSPETKKFIVVLGGVAAAAGPLLALAGTVLPAIATGLGLLLSPIGLVVAGLTAIGVVIYKNWEPIKATLIEIANYFIDLYNESIIFRIAVEGIISVFKNVFAVGKFIFDALGSIITQVAANIKAGFEPLGAIIKALLTGDIQSIPGILSDAFSRGFSDVKTLIGSLDADFEKLKTTIQNNLTEGVENAFSGKQYKLLANNVDVSEVTAKTAAAVAAGLSSNPASSTAGGAGTPQTQTVATVSAGIVNPLGPVGEQIVASTDNIRVAVEAVNETMTEFQHNAGIVGDAVGSAFGDMTGRLVDSLGLANTGFEGFVQGLLGTVTQLIAILLSQSIAQSIAGATASGTATGPGAVFATPGFIAAAVSGVAGAFAAIPKFQEGGVVGGSSFYGDKILARLNSAELVLNRNQQRDVLGLIDAGGNISGNIQIVGKLSGSDILLSGEREVKLQKRLGK